MAKQHKIPSLRSFITISISIIVTVILLVSILFYYIRTSAILTDNYRRSITAQLNQVTQQFTEQIDSIDSIIPLFLSNTLILNALESSLATDSVPKNQFYVERQMSSIYYSTALANKNFTNCLYIISNPGAVLNIHTSGSPDPAAIRSREILDTIDKTETRLMCRSLPSRANSLYFMRNLFSSNTGDYMGTFVIDIEREDWMNYCVKGLDPAWLISLFNTDLNLISNPDLEEQGLALQKMEIFHNNKTVEFQELSLMGDTYFVAARHLSGIGFSLAVCAPKELLFKDLNDTLKTYLLLLTITVFIALLTAIIISRAITKPVDKMIYHINQISRGEQTSLPPMKMYYEFEIWGDAFNQMLEKLDIYYNDNFQKQLLLKNSEIRALQSQMNPHFLFNVLNTIAWKAEISDNEEIYQMVISLGELLKMNALFKEKDFISLSQEMEYVKFYIYLQQMRFEDKISCSIRIPESLNLYLIPSFCIQPLVENAIVHGLEPKKGKGKLVVLILESENTMEISIIDNGVGFQTIPDIRRIDSSDTDTHTHIGLRNLDRRLELLFGEEARLKIDSTPNKYTTISFKIPLRKE